MKAAQSKFSREYFKNKDKYKEFLINRGNGSKNLVNPSLDHATNK